MLHSGITREIRQGPSGPKVAAFFDLDQTLLAGFSGFAFMRERLLSGRMAPRDLAEQVAGVVGFSLGRTGFSGFMTASTAMYRGLSEQALADFGEEVYEKHLATNIYPESRALVRAHQEAGHTVAIVSSATRYQVDPVARELGIDHVLCTRLVVENGAFTGEVEHPTCWREGKAQAGRQLAAELDLDLSQSYFYTDSHDDLPLLEIVGNPRPLNPDRRLTGVADEQGWPIRRFDSRGAPDAVQVLRTGLAYGSLFASALSGLSAGLLSGSRRQGVNVMMSTWGEVGTAVSGIDLEVEGEEHLWSHRPAVFIFNHQSGIDALLVMKLLRRDVIAVAKKEIRSNPIFGPLFSLGGVVFVDRVNRAQAIEALEPAVDALRRGLSLAIAPEGTRSPTPRLGAFKKGAFHIAMQAGVPIVPIVFRNALDALPKGALVVRSAAVEAVVLPPVSTEGWTVENLDGEIKAIRSDVLSVLSG